MVRYNRLTILKIQSWFYKTPIHKFFYVYVGMVFMTIKMLVKYKFDYDQIMVQIDLLKKNAKYKLQKEIERNIRINQELEEQQNRYAEIRSKRHVNSG